MEGGGVRPAAIAGDPSYGCFHTMTTPLRRSTRLDVFVYTNGRHACNRRPWRCHVASSAFKVFDKMSVPKLWSPFPYQAC
ncbi:hypothetical protein PVAP13_8KG163200 [Panicum virgatum]|uniref:Uncharacterized protein n=1 Tax=Panicum virgatum TaxID=38727 RepID=A0A8T0PH69_PANVG|nr:hypothetical protein PVAP13_8KG163200 [Panicum virgatum]